MKKNEFIKLWCEALRSGEFKQGQRRLCQDNKYCCLGVACHLAEKHEVVDLVRTTTSIGTTTTTSIGTTTTTAWNGFGDYMPVKLREFLDLKTLGGTFYTSNGRAFSLDRLNDGIYEEDFTIPVHDGVVEYQAETPLSFEDIARVIETYFLEKENANDEE